MSLLGGIIGAGSSLLGGIIGNRAAAKQQEASHQFAREQQDESEALQREFAQNGIRWRVEDAKAAGLHPLFALGGGGSAYTPSAQSVSFGSDNHMGRAVSEAGQHIARSIQPSMTAEQRETHQAQLEALRAASLRDTAHADYYASLAGRARTEPASAPFPQVPSSAHTNPDFHTSVQNPDLRKRGIGIVEVKPSEATSFAAGDRSSAAATDVAWKRYTYQDGKGRANHIWLPNANSFGEAMESVSESFAMMLAMLNVNISRNPNFMDEAREFIPFSGVFHDLSDAIWRLRHPELWRSRKPKPPGLK